MKTGFGTYAIEAGPIKGGALVAVNALGDVCGPDGKPIAGLLNPEKTACASTVEAMLSSLEMASFANTNTTIGAIVTNVKLPKALLTKVAGMAHNGYARAIRPVHTMADGDSIYALSTGDVPGDVNVVGTMAAYVMERAIVRAAMAAKSAYGFPAVSDLK